MEGLKAKAQSHHWPTRTPSLQFLPSRVQPVLRAPHNPGTAVPSASRGSQYLKQSQMPYSEFSWIIFIQPPRSQSGSLLQIRRQSPSNFKELSLPGSMISKPCPSAEGIQSLRSKTSTLISVSALLASSSVWDLLLAPCTCWGTSASWEREERAETS